MLAARVLKQAHMEFFKAWLAPLLLSAISFLPGCPAAPAAHSAAPAPVLMVCEHGSVKSVMAASLFNRGAAERHLPFRAIARGVNPDLAVPAPIALALGQEGVDVSDFVPVRVSGEDVSAASRVVAIG